MSNPSGNPITVYAGTHVADQTEGIYILHLNASTGDLTPVSKVPDVRSPFFLDTSPDGQYLYAGCVLDEFNGEPGGSVKAFAIDQKTGDLTLLNEQPAKGTVPCYVSVDKTGRCLLVANYSSGSVAAFPINENGTLEPASQVTQHEGASVHPERQEGPHIHSIVLSPDHRYAFAADLGTDKVQIYKLNASTATLEPNDQPFVSAQPGAGPRHLAFHPNETRAYLFNELDNTFVVYHDTAKSGTLKERQTVSALPNDYTGTSYAADIVVHPSGRFLYGSNREHNSIAIMTINASTGELTPLAHQPTEPWPWNLEIDPTGTFLLSANQRGNSVTVFRIDQNTGTLQPVENSVEVPGAVCIKTI